MEVPDAPSAHHPEDPLNDPRLPHVPDRVQPDVDLRPHHQASTGHGPAERSGPARARFQEVEHLAPGPLGPTRRQQRLVHQLHGVRHAELLLRHQEGGGAEH
eukprot:11176795-Lingulodinium_polyedra.AAC.1